MLPQTPVPAALAAFTVMVVNFASQPLTGLHCFLINRHTVMEARARGWEELENGDLLREAEAAAAGFEVLVTTDKNLSYQQDLKGRKMAIVVVGLGRWSLVRHLDLLCAQSATKIGRQYRSSTILASSLDATQNSE